jgi:hypothetical protein
MDDHTADRTNGDDLARYWRIRTLLEFVKLAMWTVIHAIHEGIRIR